jgi:uncharacterized protein
MVLNNNCLPGKLGTPIREGAMKIKVLVSLSAALAVTVLVASAWAGPLHDAAREGDIAAVKGLITGGADVQEIDDDTALTPLVAAALAGHKGIVELLIESGADPSGRDGKGFTALHAAAYGGHLDIVVLLIDRGVDPNDHQNKAGITPLHAAVEGDFRDIVAVLLAKHVDVDVEDGSGRTPLMRATFKSYPEMVKLLRDHGATCSKNAGKAFLEYCMTAGT